MKRVKHLSAAVGILLSGMAVAKADPQEGQTRFASTVQLALQESNPIQMNRAQNVVIQEFEKTLNASPTLRDAQMSIQRTGNEVVFSVMTDEDLRAAMQQVVTHMIQSFNRQKLRMRGRTSFYRTSFPHPMQGELFMTLHDPVKRTLYIEAEQAPLIDLLQEMRRQMPGFSYIIPQECAQRRVYFTFGHPQKEKHPDTLELKAAMGGIAEMLRVKVEDMGGAFVFAGDCQGGDAAAPGGERRMRETEVGWPEIMPMRWPVLPTQIQEKPARNMPVAVVDPRSAPPLLQSQLPTQVYFPVTPIGYER